MALSKWAFLGSLLATEEDLAGQPEYEAWKKKHGKSDPALFIEEAVKEHAAAQYNNGIAYSVYRPGGDDLIPFIHVGDFADEKSALTALATEKGEAFCWNQEGKVLATRYESEFDEEDKDQLGGGEIRVQEKGIAPFRKPVTNQAKLESTLVEVEQHLVVVGSLITARKFLQIDNKDASIFNPNKMKGGKAGPIVWSDSNIYVQDVGHGKYVAHASSDVDKAMSLASLTERDLRKDHFELKYENGKLAIAKPDLNLVQQGKIANQSASSTSGIDVRFIGGDDDDGASPK